MSLVTSTLTSAASHRQIRKAFRKLVIAILCAAALQYAALVTPSRHGRNKLLMTLWI